MAAQVTELGSGPDMGSFLRFRPPGGIAPGERLEIGFQLTDIGILLLRFSGLAALVDAIANGLGAVLPGGTTFDVQVVGNTLYIIVENPPPTPAARAALPGAVVAIVPAAVIIAAVGAAVGAILLAFTVFWFAKTVAPGVKEAVEKVGEGIKILAYGGAVALALGGGLFIANSLRQRTPPVR